MEIKELRTTDISIDLRYQRQLNLRTVDKIVNNFDEEKLGVITVANRDGKFYCVDGQHRLNAIRKLGGETIWAQITYPKNEADLFVELNTSRKPPRPYDIYRARLEAGDEKTIELDEALKSINYRMANKDESDVNTIKCPVLAQKIFNNHGKDHFIRTIFAVSEIYEQEEGSNSDSIISGYSYFLLHAKVDNSDFVKKMRRFSVKRLRREATDLLIETRLTKPMAYAKAIQKLYNFGRRKKVYMND